MNFLQPATLPELAQGLAQMSGPDCHLLSGCTDFLTMRNGKPWTAQLLLSLANLPQLREIRLVQDRLSIGACCTHTQVEENPLVGRYFPALVCACGNVGSKQIRNRGTVGGSIANASPAGDIYPVFLVLGALAVVMNGAGETRRLPMEKMVLGVGKTALNWDEAIVFFELPLLPANNLNAFVKLGERARVTIAKINLAASLRLEGGLIREAKISLGAVSERAFLSPSAEGLNGRPLSGELLPDLFTHLSREIQNSIPNRPSMPYKRQAVLGLADELLNALVRQKTERDL